MKLLLILFFIPQVVIGVVTPNFNKDYDQSIIPYYNSFELKKFSYHNDLTKNFVYKFIKNDSKSLVVILPGKGEQIIRYAEMIYDLRSADTDILLIQFRGQGLSSRSLDDHEKYHLQSFNDVVEDINNLFEENQLKQKYKKIILFAHSMGAHHGLKLHAKYQTFNEIILNSPLIGLFDKSKTLQNYYLAKVLDMLGLDDFYVPGGGKWRDRTFEVNPLSSSKSRYEKIRQIEFEAVDHRMGSVTVRWAHEAFRSEKNLFSNLDKFKVPIALFQAGKESVISNEKQTTFCQKVKSCQLFHLEGAKHNIMQERDEYRTPLLNYIKATL